MSLNLITLKQGSVYGKAVARKVFRERGNHSEAHLTEKELAELVSAAICASQHDFELNNRSGSARAAIAKAEKGA